jgi:hypothetical protein
MYDVYLFVDRLVSRFLYRGATLAYGYMYFYFFVCKRSNGLMGLYIYESIHIF